MSRNDFEAQAPPLEGSPQSAPERIWLAVGHNAIAKVGYRPDIDGLRAIAILTVVFYHYGIRPFGGGYVGVDVFFVISGFLITSLISDDIARSDFSIAGFYERRIRRIFPALVAVLIVACAVGFTLLLPNDLKNFGQSLAATALLSSNLEFWREAGYFDSAQTVKPLLHTWSVTVEEQFYLVFPFFLICLVRFPKAYAAAGLLLIWTASLVASQVLTLHHPSSAFYLLPSRFWELVLGSALALVVTAAPRTALAANAASLVGLGLILGAAIAYTADTAFPGLAALAPCVGAALVIYGGRRRPPPAVNALLAVRPMVLLGLMSYSLYLWHWPVLVFAGYVAPRLSLLARALLLVLSLLLAALSWRYVEQPFRGKSVILSRRTLFAAATCAMAAAVVLGGLVTLRKGFPGRYDPEISAILAVEGDYHGASACTASDSGLPLCRIGDPAAASPDFAVWGDSIANSMLPALEGDARAKGRAGWHFEHDGCPPLIGLARQDEPDCAAFNRRVLDFLLRAKLRDVVLIARWALNAEGSRYGAEPGGPITLSGEGLVCSQSCDRRLFEDGLTNTVRKLTAAGTRVTIIDSIPEIGFDPPSMLVREKLFGFAGKNAPSRAEFEARQRFVRPVLQKLASDYGVSVVEVAPFLCGETCPIEIGGRPVYSDNHHLSNFGAHLLDPLFRRKLL